MNKSEKTEKRENGKKKKALAQKYRKQVQTAHRKKTIQSKNRQGKKKRACTINI